MKRRGCLAALAALGPLPLAGLPRIAQAHAGPGPVSPPVAAPDLVFTDHLGRPQRLRAWLTGHVTAVQTVFTGCSSVCPLQAALFAAAQKRLAGQTSRTPVRWLSISIDPLGDTPALLHAWLQRAGTPPAAWVAGLPRMADVEPLRRALDGSATEPLRRADGHSDKVYFFDAQAQMRWRSASLPSADDVVRVVRHLAA
jgi:protein SCO1